MRFKHPMTGDKRKRWKFLWFPWDIKGYHVWLEWAFIEEEYINEFIPFSGVSKGWFHRKTLKISKHKPTASSERG